MNDPEMCYKTNFETSFFQKKYFLFFSKLGQTVTAVQQPHLMRLLLKKSFILILFALFLLSLLRFLLTGMTRCTRQLFNHQENYK